MEIILLEKIKGHGNIGDIVRVKDGFAKNYLFPLKKALRATKENKAFFESKKAEIEKRNADALKEAETLVKKIDGLSLVVIRQAGDSGHLYGSVSSKDLSALLKEKGYQVNNNYIKIDTPIKEIGIYTINIDLHADVVAKISVNVARSDDEAKSALKKLAEEAKKAEAKKKSAAKKADKAEENTQSESSEKEETKTEEA